MDSYLIYTAILLSILTFYTIIYLRKQHLSRNNKLFPYTLNKYILSKSELMFYRELSNALKSENILIFPKVRLADILTVENIHANYGYLNKIKSKHVDFVICTKDSTPIVCIELDGTSHYRKSSKENDKFKNLLFDELDIKLIRLSVSQKYDFSFIISQVQSRLSSLV